MLAPEVADFGNDCSRERGDGFCILVRRRHQKSIGANRWRIGGQPIERAGNRALFQIRNARNERIDLRPADCDQTRRTGGKLRPH